MVLTRAAALVCLSLFATVARAEDKAAARQAYEEGTKYYDLNQFSDALQAFKRAYWNYEEPAFLFNIAQCHRQLGNATEAVKFYRSYLRKVPDAPNRAEVEKVVASLEESIARPTPPPPPTLTAPVGEPTASTPPSAESTNAATTVVASSPLPKKTPVYKKWWLWTIVGLVAAGAVGVAVGVTQSQPTERSLSQVHFP